MNLLLKRTDFTDTSTIGSLYVNGGFFCYILEDKDRGLNQGMSLVEISARKIFGKTAIPYGTYTVKLSMSNRFKRLLPEILNVKGYESVRIHRGNTAEDTLGCLIVGLRKAYNSVFESTAAETALMRVLQSERNYPITLTIEKAKTIA